MPGGSMSAENRHASGSLYPALQDYPRNQWYVAAFSRDVGREPIARVLLDTPVLLYRTEAGDAVALLDRCPHRGLPLSMGSLIGDRIRCRYHGMEFGSDGACKLIPAQDIAPAAMRVLRYPLVEKWQWLWIWMGDPALADENLIPDHDWLGLDRPGYHATPFFVMEIGANFQFMHDNLLDSTHVSFLHAGALDSGDEMASAKIKIEQDGQILRIAYHTPASCFSDNVAAYFRVQPNKPYDRVLSNETFVPSISIGKQIIRDPQAPEAPPIELYAINALTPASADRTYVHHAQITSFDPQWTPEDIDGVRGIVEQDRVAIEAIQQRFALFGDTSEVSILTDNMGIRSRRAIAALCKAETLRAQKPVGDA
jgi:phenylpropionate dioxygenase-like ring-hydroxylating dioxygenase large terminal subunit